MSKRISDLEDRQGIMTKEISELKERVDDIDENEFWSGRKNGELKKIKNVNFCLFCLFSTSSG